MRAVVQRVSRAAVRVDGNQKASISKGLLVLLGVEKGDSAEEIVRFAERLPRHRFFTDADGKMNLSLKDVGGSILVVSQFTLAANLAKGLRPSFDPAMEPDRAREFVGVFVDTLRSAGIDVKEGVFGAHMEVELVNDGPVTFAFQGAL
ncbi:MAG: D-tyrosyl-tRNA(Tyr) deacylase [Candidatus Stahlbacteria bacterium]|nr:MAG: D-tyrosyl-tRNA(Tyr) deacylase [Candidatus Stahlbacteria bacterium]